MLNKPKSKNANTSRMLSFDLMNALAIFPEIPCYITCVLVHYNNFLSIVESYIHIFYHTVCYVESG